MQIPNEALLLRIFIGESDRWQHKPLYEAIVLKAREARMHGGVGPRQALEDGHVVPTGRPLSTHDRHRAG